MITHKKCAAMRRLQPPLYFLCNKRSSFFFPFSHLTSEKPDDPQFHLESLPSSQKFPISSRVLIRKVPVYYLESEQRAYRENLQCLEGQKTKIRHRFSSDLLSHLAKLVSRTPCQLGCARDTTSALHRRLCLYPPVFYAFRGSILLFVTLFLPLTCFFSSSRILRISSEVSYWRFFLIAKILAVKLIAEKLLALAWKCDVDI
ncbi:hypothetical protein M9H77_06223 [Catharanthus roseus]|uniref:Uncharacterized protein n=1 Tax=Catharanthus roseus TaxID=4058 RepID=A0ACC0BRP6_CATRO|nr:hypothetical protein M9H77_06223 [Catharanthus roseus]